MSTPLNEEALANLRLLANRATEEVRYAVIEPDILHSLLDMVAVSAYLTVAQPVVNSVEELDALPVHSYVQGYDGFKHAKDWNGGWHLIVNRPSSAPHLSGSIELPATVLYRPEVSDA